MAAERRAPRRLLLAHLTLLHVAPPAFVGLAARAGFDGVSLHVSQPGPGEAGVRYPMLGPDSAMMRETLARLADTGLAVHDVQGVRLKPQTDVADFEPVFEAGQRLGARYAMTVSEDSDPGRVADRLAALAALAGRYGLTPVLEFMAYSGVRTLVEARNVLARAASPNLAIMVDALHWARSGGTLQDIADTPPALMPYLQFCDGPRRPPPGGDEGLMREARRQRGFPGEGELPLRDFLAAFAPDLPLSVEVPVADWHDRLDDFAIARRAMESTRRCLVAAATPLTEGDPS
jgi:sugar phosphate isomerase/epimerase